jgi:GH18 family chitinase
MIHLAHSANVQIYASITLSPSKLLGLDIGTFVTHAMSLLSTTNFDGLDIYITTSLDHVNEDTNSIVMALQSLLMVLQPELLSLMDTNGRTYGLSLVVLPSCDIATTTDESVYTQDFINILKSVGELNLLSYNPPPTTNDDIVPTSSPILPTWQQPPTSTTINSTTATTTTSNNDNCQAIEESVAVWGSRGILPDKINVGLSTTTTTTDNTDVCEQVKYGISSGWNGYFLW